MASPQVQRVAITGSTGAIGSRLASALARQGIHVVSLVRNRANAPGQVLWNPETGEFDVDAVGACDAFIHLTGQNIATRWTKRARREIRASRVDVTRALCERLARLPHKPHTLLAASAIGIYGDRGDELCDETSGRGSGFLADLCADWEAAAAPALEAGIRVVHLRTGIVLSAGSGALAQMLRFARLGMAGRVGSGQQWISWIAMEDELAAIEFALRNEALRGPVNLVTAATRQIDFIRTLGRVIRRPTIAPLPAFAARLLFGKMADEILLGSTRVVPKRLEEAGFRPTFPDLESALRFELDKASK